MKAVATLPEGYSAIHSVDLKKDKKIHSLIILTYFILAIVSGIAMHLWIPIQTFFSMEDGLGNYVFRSIGFLILYALYRRAHELMHGVAMKMCGTKRVEYSFAFQNAFTTSSDYYDKRAYSFIALTPVVFLGSILAIISILVPIDWFWVISLVQLMNIAGAAGDLFVTVHLARFSKDILIREYGTSVTVYSLK